MGGWEIAGTIADMVAAVGAVAAVIVALHMHYRDGLPCVVAYLEHDDDNDAVVLVLANAGKGVAWNVLIDGFESSMVKPDLLPAVERSFAFHKVDCLVPGTELRTVIHAKENIRHLAGKRCDVKVGYEEDGFFPFRKRRSASDEFTLSYGDMVGAVYTRSNLGNINQNMGKAVGCLEKTNDEISRLANAMGKLSQGRPEEGACQATSEPKGEPDGAAG